MGASVAMGALDPGMEYWRSVADGEGEAMLFKARFDALRQSRNS